ncbi:beta strand repeat-containing protein [Paracidobacterium acidisoli]|nr:FG-GAP-like repeat-containing protein [Paracidobacterium acidisoli]MBT9332636.1 VCBS repeat-containing protein [Paracidobacterium acidisoli]
MFSSPTNRRSFFAHVPVVLLSVLAGIALCMDTAYGQQNVLASPQQLQTRPLHVQLAGEQPRPLAMVSGDFDEDGVQDLAVGYGLTKGGSILLLKGNLDARAPQTQASWEAAGRHQYSDPYLQSSKPVSVAAEPDLMIAADVNGDGHLDVVYATKGSTTLNVMFGDGKGNFRAPVSASVAGGITALASYRPGSPLSGEAIIAGTQSNNGARLSVLTYSGTALTARAAYPLPGAATAMTAANLDADLIPDIAVVAGGKVMILHGKTALSGRGSLTTVPVSGAESVTTGEFLFDRHAQLQLAVLTTSGDVVILAHSGFDPRPYTPQQIAQTRRRGNSESLAQQAGNNGNEPWVEVETNTGAAASSTDGKPPILLRSRISGSGGDDLVVVNSSQQQRTLISHAAVSSQSSVAAETSRVTSDNIASDNVVAAVSSQVTPATSHGLVLLSADNISPDFTVPSTGNTFYVNTPADNTGTTTDPDDGTRCTSGSSEVCTLRDAVTFANNDASDNISAGKSDTIMVPAGTYTLTWQKGTTDANTNAVTHLEILGPVTIIGTTTGGGTIISGGNNDTVFTINPGMFGSENPSGNSYVFDTTLENLTIENGKNTNNINNNGLANFVGGGLNWDADGTGNLTLTNTVVENNTVLWGPGGGIWAQNSAGGGTGTLTISGGSIANNSTPELGGGIQTAFPPAAVSITNTTITGNKAQISINPGDGDADGSGGGLYLEGRQPPPATPQSTLSGVTISSNTAANDNGGGIATFTGVLISGSLFSSNSTGGSGGGIWSNPAGDGSQTTITSSNFLTNSASGTGGAIALGIETQAEGNILNVSLSRIVGNTATGGGSGLANGVSGEGAGEAIATENWWGCNSGPATASDGCDQAVLENGAGSLTTAPYAKLTFTSDIMTIPPGGSMNLTVGLNTDSNNNTIAGAFPAVATNYPYTFNVTGVTADPALTTGTFNTSGVGTAVLTPSTTGSGMVTVTFDNQTDNINFTAQGATATSLSITAIPSTTFLYGQPSGFTVQLTPSNATGITAANFQVTVDGASNIGGSSFGLILIGNNDYQIFGPFNLLSPGGHSLAVKFLGTTNFAASSTSTPLNVLAGTVTIGSTVTPTNPLLGQGGSVAVSVAGVGTGAVPTGSLSYAFDGGSSNVVSLAGGAATIPIPTTLSAGSHSLAITYSGDGNYATASTSVPFTVFGPSQTRIASLTPTTATIDVFGFGFTAPSGQLSFTDVTSGSPVAAPVTLNTASAAPSLLPQVTTSTGANSLPVWTDLADVNGDGNPDLITSVFGTDSINVQLGNGNGTFGAATSILISAGFGPAEVHAVSLRGNGTMDLVVGSFNVNQIAVLLGNGNGTFQPPTLYTVGTAASTPTSLTTGDFNHDGNLDVAAANTGNNNISILLGNGSGALTPLGAPIAVGRDPEAIRSGDFNSDGYSDLAVANYGDGTVTILLNNKNGTFAASHITTGAGPQALAINGTGTNLLLAVANYLGNTVSVLPSNNDGTFGTAKVVSVGRGPDEVRFADFNGDSIPDLAVANYTDGTVSLVLGSSGGSYTALSPFQVGNNPYSAAVGDIDRDGTPDLVVANCFSNNTGVLLGGTQISVPYSGLALTPGDTLHATYTPDGSSKYGSSTSPNVTAP